MNSYSASWVGTIGSAAPLHPDFGSVYGMPYILVPGSQTKYPATFEYSGESDPGPYAAPLDAPVEGGSSSNGDRHVLSIDTDNCILYEMWSAYPQAASWSAGSGAIYNLNSNALRPSGWTSADAAGLPVFPGLVRYDEVAAGQINHALRFTAPQTLNQPIWPARHVASSLSGYQFPPLGSRFRLRADFDISRFSPVNQVILTALKKYGMILADNGTSWFLSGTTDPRWNDDDLHALTQIPGSAFEAVDESGIMVSPDSGQTTIGGAPSISVSINPTSATVTTGSSVQLNASVSNATNQAVAWTVNGIPGGNDTVGIVTWTGMYTAPAAVPNGGAVTVTATSTAAPNVSASATVMVNAPVQPTTPTDTQPTTTDPTPTTPTTTDPTPTTPTTTDPTPTQPTPAEPTSPDQTTVVTPPIIVAPPPTTEPAPAPTESAPTQPTTSDPAPSEPAAPVASVPVIGSVSPSTITRGETASVTISGSNFSPGATVLIHSLRVFATNVVVVDSNTITADIITSGTTPIGTFGLTVTTASGTSNTFGITFQ